MSLRTVGGLVLLLLGLVPTARGIDPGRASGHVLIDGERIVLREAAAHLHRGAADRLLPRPELRIVLADNEIPQAALAGLEPLPVLGLARAGRLRGLLLRLDPDDATTLTVTLLAAATASVRRPRDCSAKCTSAHRCSATDD